MSSAAPPIAKAQEILAEGHHRLCSTHRSGECDCYWSRKTTFVLARAVVELADSLAEVLGIARAVSHDGAYVAFTRADALLKQAAEDGEPDSVADLRKR